MAVKKNEWPKYWNVIWWMVANYNLWPSVRCEVIPRQPGHVRITLARHSHRKWEESWLQAPGEELGLFYVLSVLASSVWPDNTALRRQMYHIQKMYCQQTSCSYCLQRDRFLWHFAEIDTSQIIVITEKIPPGGWTKTRTFQFWRDTVLTTT